MKAKNISIIKALLKKFGKQAAIDKIQEEAQELALALHQYKCITKNNKERRLNDIYEELADMKIQLRNAEMIFSRKKINKLVNKKLAEKAKKHLL